MNPSYTVAFFFIRSEKYTSKSNGVGMTNRLRSNDDDTGKNKTALSPPRRPIYDVSKKSSGMPALY